MHHARPSSRPLPRRGVLAGAAAGIALTAAACSEEEEPPVDDGGVGAAEESPSPSPSPEPPRSITITHVGDTMPGSYPDNMPSDEGASFFNGVVDELTGDVVIANMEGALSTLEFDKCGGCDAYYFRLPGEYAQVFADAGFHVLNQANNHGWDAGPDGAVETQEAIRAAGMEVTGVKDEVAYVELDGLTVGIVGFAPYYFYTDVRDLDAVSALVAEAKSQADLVVATAHLGAEGSDQMHTPEGVETYYGEDRGDTRAFAHTCVDAGADLVIGHGPHVLRGMEMYNGKLIAYSLGNFGGGQKLFSTDGPLGVAGILKVTLSVDGVVESGTLIPTVMDDDNGYPLLDPDGEAIDTINELAGDFENPVTLADDGALVLPDA